MDTEQHLIEAIKSGNHTAMHQFYERFASRVMAVALRYMGSRDDALDVVQDAFVKMLTSVERFDYRGEGSLAAWVVRVVSNTAVTALRSRNMLVNLSEAADLPDEPDPPPQRVPPDVLTRLIGTLPAGYRTVLNLYVFEQYSHQQIANMLGIKAETSSSQLTRARRLLARRIKEYLNNHHL